MNEDFLKSKLAERKENHSFRQLKIRDAAIDFCSNDYLGIVKNNLLNDHANHLHKLKSGSTGSRLLSGNYEMIIELESQLARFHDAEAALIFNSGYDANLGLISCVARKGDTIIYDQLSHASIRDGIRLSFAQSYSYAHNDCADLEKKLSIGGGTIFVVTESVFSMDGDMAPLVEVKNLCEKYEAHLIVDEAHATGIIGEGGEGMCQTLGIHPNCFARIYTFGKALGTHGAVITRSHTLKDYLVNFARSFVFTTALPEAAIATIHSTYDLFPHLSEERQKLKELIDIFQGSHISHKKLPSHTPIQVVIIPGNEEVREVAAMLQQHNLDVRPIVYPTVPKGAERLRIVLHSFNTKPELEQLLKLLS